MTDTVNWGVLGAANFAAEQMARARPRPNTTPRLPRNAPHRLREAQDAPAN